MSGDTPTPGVSDHIRERVAEVGVEALAGRAGCLGKACITPCQAQTLLDAYDDSAAEVERLDMLNKVETAVRVKAQADVSRMTALASLPSRAHRVAHVLMDFGDAFDGTPMGAVWAALPGYARDDVRGAWGRLLAEVDDSEVERLTERVTSQRGTAASKLSAAWSEVERLTRERDALATLVGDAIVRTSLMPGEYRPATHALTVAVDAIREHALAAERVLAAAKARSASDGRVVVQMGIRNREMMDEVEAAIRERDVLRELVRAAQHHIPRSWPQWPAWAKRAFEVSGSGDYEDSTTDETDEMTAWREWAKTSMISVEEHEANRALEADEDLAASASEPGNAEWIAWNEGGMVGSPPSGSQACECGPGARAVDGMCTACSLQVEPGGDQ